MRWNYVKPWLLKRTSRWTRICQWLKHWAPTEKTLSHFPKVQQSDPTETAGLVTVKSTKSKQQPCLITAEDCPSIRLKPLLWTRTPIRHPSTHTTVAQKRENSMVRRHPATPMRQQTIEKLVSPTTFIPGGCRRWRRELESRLVCSTDRHSNRRTSSVRENIIPECCYRSPRIGLRFQY
ncbi:hypothetical protein LSAT2_025499 [Lamellibrachia satsuma]|nr:hypothetical protein LSAT2_025499 [Lamellibrachia satsuma]